MATFYIRPRAEAGYGTGDGKSYANAWNGIEAVDWDAVAANNPATFWICGAQVRPTTGVLAVFVEWDYSAQRSDDQFARAIAKIAGFRTRVRAANPVVESQGDAVKQTLPLPS